MFFLQWTPTAAQQYEALRKAAEQARDNREAAEKSGKSGKKKKSKPSKQEGLFSQVRKALNFLQANPRHPGLNTHEYDSLPHPWDSRQKVFEAYAQNKTPGAYRIFWAYGPDDKQITIVAITPHP